MGVVIAKSLLVTGVCLKMKIYTLLLIARIGWIAARETESTNTRRQDCKEGYNLEGQFESKQTFFNINSSQKCGELCDDLAGCVSYEHSYSKKICTLNTVTSEAWRIHGDLIMPDLVLCKAQTHKETLVMWELACHAPIDRGPLLFFSKWDPLEGA